MTVADSSPPRPRWPYAGRGQAQLLVASLAAIVAAFLPWLLTPVGDLGGFSGPGGVTFYIGFVGIAGSIRRRRRVVLWHAVVVAVVFAALPAWQVVRAGSVLGWRGWFPGIGLLLTFVAGLTAAYAALQLRRED